MYVQDLASEWRPGADENYFLKIFLRMSGQNSFS
jgi:hypothetical protein